MTCRMRWKHFSGGTIELRTHRNRRRSRCGNIVDGYTVEDHDCASATALRLAQPFPCLNAESQVVFHCGVRCPVAANLCRQNAQNDPGLAVARSYSASIPFLALASKVKRKLAP
jgi:hypothetical protein